MDLRLGVALRTDDGEEERDEGRDLDAVGVGWRRWRESGERPKWWVIMGFRVDGCDLKRFASVL